MHQQLWLAIVPCCLLALCFHIPFSSVLFFPTELFHLFLIVIMIICLLFYESQMATEVILLRRDEQLVATGLVGWLVILISFLA